MKKHLLIICAFAFCILACENQENEFDDFGSTSVYFPFQTPIRTLILGEYDLGFNENDNNHRFEIGVTMSGVYENNKNRKVYFELAPDLINSTLLGVDSVNVQVLPSSYYTIEQESPVTIPKGSIKGRIPVQLNDAFFEDPLSFAGDGEVHYVIPLEITQIEELDSLLTGVPVVDSPIKIKSDDWQTVPKDYTLFGIKFMNKYQGVYLRRGADEMTNAGGETVNNVYHEEFVVKDELVTLSTTGKDKIELSNLVRRGGLSSPGNVNIELAFNENGDCTINSFDEDPYNVSGSGKFVQDGDEWGGEKRDVIYLDYSYTDAVNNETHAVKDTLVIRDRNVKFEEFTVELTE
ncbi:DUF5627 domain-containing protein [Algibacter lectus]|uniref:Uncharacterized protein DUF1735 n=1 Tax=Algibacter lectus TaxID=221126 RepID=A0A4V3HH78_9FLAO|nr:DUF5627 domain-containing protein [Algibacter lectus]MWW23171.1 DUF1735 domain-containing protein [Algibacter lectus]TDY64151.1 uncharacterized protein DUF1735 [Algibacter lectus]